MRIRGIYFWDRPREHRYYKSCLWVIDNTKIFKYEKKSNVRRTISCLKSFGCPMIFIRFRNGYSRIRKNINDLYEIAQQ